MTVAILKAAAAAPPLTHVPVIYSKLHTLQLAYCYTHDNELIGIKNSQNSLRPLYIVTWCQGSLTV